MEFTGMNPYNLRDGEVSSGVSIYYFEILLILILAKRQLLWQSSLTEESCLVRILAHQLGLT